MSRINDSVINWGWGDQKDRSDSRKTTPEVFRPADPYGDRWGQNCYVTGEDSAPLDGVFP